MEYFDLVWRIENPKPGSHTLTQHEFSHELHVEPYHKERVQILQRVDIQKIERMIVKGQQYQV